MILDIFSMFDPKSFNSYMPLYLMIPLSVLTIIIIFLPIINPLPTNRINSFKSPIISTIFSQLSRTYMINLKGLSLIVSSLFMLIILTNLLGMSPYMFSLSSHLLMTLSIGLPMWASMIISSAMFSPKQTTAHLLPDGAPEWLNPFLVMIETTSVLVRPLTLSFRLAANMTAGHVVLSLSSTYSVSTLHTSQMTLILLLLTSTGYIMFEFAICLIQAYIFCLLLSLYADDHS